MRTKVTKDSCLSCGNEVARKPNKFCCQTCQTDWQYKNYIERWIAGLETGYRNDNNYSISMHVRRYLFEKYGSSCQLCKWSKKNEVTDKVPLTVHHIDGNAKDCSSNNLQLLCPNCHSLTKNYGSLNKASPRRRGHLSNGKTLALHARN